MKELSSTALMEVIRVVVTAKLLETGKFDEEISKLNEATKALAEQNGITRTLANVKQLEAKAERILYEADAKAKTRLDEVEHVKLNLKVREDKLEVDRAEFRRLSDEKNKRLAALDAELSTRQRALLEGEVALNARTIAVERKEATLSTREQTLIAGERALAERVARVKAAAL